MGVMRMNGITKDEIQKILNVPDIKIDGLAEAIEKIINRNNELIFEYLKSGNKNDKIKKTMVTSIPVQTFNDLIEENKKNSNINDVDWEGLNDN